MKKQPLAVLALAVILGLASCGGRAISSSASSSVSSSVASSLPSSTGGTTSEGDGSSSAAPSSSEAHPSSETSSTGAGASSSEPPVSSSPESSSEIPPVSSESSSEPTPPDSSESTPEEPDEEKIPEGLIGVWEGNDGHRYLKLTVTGETLDLNGIAGEIISPFASHAGSLRARVSFGETTYYVDFIENGEDSSVFLTDDAGNAAELHREGSIDVPLPPLSEAFVGTWTGIDADTMIAYTLVVDESGVPNLNGVKGEVQFIDDTGARASVYFGGVLYELSLSSNGLLLETADHDFSIVLALKEPEEEVEPIVLVPEAEWIGTWSNAEHTLVVGTDGYWTLDGTKAVYAEKWASGYSIRLEKGGSMYQLSLTEVDGMPAMLVETLQGKWTLMKEGVEPPAPTIELPAGWLGTWSGLALDGSTIKVTVNEDGTYAVEGAEAEGVSYDEEKGVLSLTVDGLAAEARLEWNQGIYEIRIALAGVEGEIVLRHEGEAPVVLPEGWLGEWKGTVNGEEIAITVGIDMKIVDASGAELRGWTYDEEKGELSIAYLGMAVTVKLEGEKLALYMGDLLLGYLERPVAETEPIYLPTEWTGNWKGEDANTGTAYAVEIAEDGTAKINGEEAQATEVDDYGFYTLVVGEIEYTLNFETGADGTGYLILTVFSQGIYAKLYADEPTEPEPEPEPDEPAVEIPTEMVGYWETNDGLTTLKVNADGTVVYNGVAGKITAVSESSSYGVLYEGAFGAGEKNMEFSFLDNMSFELSDEADPWNYFYLYAAEEPDTEPDEPAIEIPTEMVGEWASSDGAHKLTVNADGTVVYDGTDGKIAEIATTSYGASGKIDLGGVMTGFYFYFASGSLRASIGIGFDPSLYKVETAEPEPEPEPDEPVQGITFPDELVGTWSGSDLYTGDEITLVVEADGTVTYNGIVATDVTSYNEDIEMFTFKINGDLFRATLKLGGTLTLSCTSGLTLVTANLTK